MLERALVNWLDEDYKNMKMVIYMLIFPNWKYYIGQTINELKIRVSKDHSLIKSKINTHKDRAVNKYKTFDVLVLDVCNTLEELNEKEQYWIDLYNTTDGEYGYNMMKGGNAHEYNNEKSKLDAGRKISVSLKEYYKNNESVHKGVKRSLESIEKQKISHKKYYEDNYSHNAKKIICLIDGKIFNSVGECCEYYNIDCKLVIDSCKTGRVGQYGNCIGLCFSYYEDGVEYDIGPREIPKNNPTQSIKCMSIPDNIVFDSISKCCKYYKDIFGGFVIQDYLDNGKIHKKSGQTFTTIKS